jgi:mannose-6-phosphate isomerase-like protein (cupin superfamily)
VAQVHDLADLARSPAAALFEGARHGEGMAVSFFVTAYPHGHGPDLHLHPYAEVFLVQEGQAAFTAGDEEIVAHAAQVVVVPPETAHGFKNSGDGTLRVVSMHPSPSVQQTDL